MALMAVLESDLRSLSSEARRRYPAVKDGAEHAILKLRALSTPSDIAQNEDILRIFLKACEVKNVKLSVIGLSCLQKLISHDAVAPSALKDILSTLKEHAEMNDESVQLRTLQTILIIFQSSLHPGDEANMAQALGMCLRLLESNRSPDSVRNTAEATFRQAVALVFDHVARAESLPSGRLSSGGQIFRSSSVTGDVNRSIHRSEEYDTVSGAPRMTRDSLTKAGTLGLRLLEDLTALAAGGSATWLRISSVQRSFALDILEFVLSDYVALFRSLAPYEQVLRHQICSLLMTSLRTNAELEGETGEPFFRRLVLRSVAHIIRHYSSSLITETEVFLSMLVRVTALDLPLWLRILVLEILRGFCVEVRTMRVLFLNFDMHPSNTNVVENMVKALARVVSSLQGQDTSDESLVAVAGMFSSKAKGIEWSLDNDASNAAVLVASEAHAITLAIEGLLGVVFSIATLTDEAVDVGELESPKCEPDTTAKLSGKTAFLCYSMVDSLWLMILDSFSLILARSQGEAIVLEILKGYQAFTQACGVLHAVEPLNSFLASLCKFTINIPNELEKKSTVSSPGPKRAESLVDQRDSIILTSKNVQALRTLFNIAHRLHNVLGNSWVLVLETLAALDRTIHSPHATTQELSTTGARLSRESSGHYSDFNILSSLNSQLFESSGLMDVSAVQSLVSALCLLSQQSLPGVSGGSVPPSSHKIGSISFSVERMISILVNNVHRLKPLWDPVVGHFLELAEHSNQQLRNMALDALDRSIGAVLGSNQFQDRFPTGSSPDSQHKNAVELRLLERAVISPLRVLYFSGQSFDVRAGSLKILLHVLERHGEKLNDSWQDILEMLRSVASATEKDLVTLGFQCLQVIMNDGFSSIPVDCLETCIDVTGAYSAQKTELNISLTAVGLLWTATDFIAKGLAYGNREDTDPAISKSTDDEGREKSLSLNKSNYQASSLNVVERDKLLISIFSLLQTLGADERPEVRNSAIRTLFQTLGTHGQKLSESMWEDCLWNYVFPSLDHASHMVATSSKDEWRGKELGTRDGKAVHMLIHHSRNTAQKQWDETLVVVLSGIARLLRSFFPYLKTLSDFWSGWQSLIGFVKNSITNGSKEVALAAINCLQTTALSHSAKGNLPRPYLISVLDVYEDVLSGSEYHNDSAASRVKQEILLGLGELFVQAHMMYDADMYKQLLEIVHSIVQSTMPIDNVEADSGCIPPMQRTMLEILPLLCPSEHLSSMWSYFLLSVLRYLPGAPLPSEGKQDTKQVGSLRDSVGEAERTAKHESSNGKISASATTIEAPSESGLLTTTISGIHCSLFCEKLIPVLVDLFVQAPDAERHNIYPEIIQALGRCMTTRRENPDGAIWRLAVEGFNRILVDDVNRLSMKSETLQNIGKSLRNRFWKEVVGVFEIFLVGYCGRALPSNTFSTVTLEADISLDMAILSVLGDKILKSQIDAPFDVLQRLVSSLDHCASRTCSLPVETVELLPPHCFRFSLTCLQKLFCLTSFEDDANNCNPTRTDVRKIAIMVLLERCEYIFNKFLIDEANLGERPLPAVRLEEVVYVLQQLPCLIIHPDTESVLPLPPHLKNSVTTATNLGVRTHLLVLYPSLCELVISRELRIRELVMILLRLVSELLGIQKLAG